MAITLWAVLKLEAGLHCITGCSQIHPRASLSRKPCQHGFLAGLVALSTQRLTAARCKLDSFIYAIAPRQVLLLSSLVEATPVSFELELLQLGKDGKATVIDREQCPLELSLAKLKAQQILEEKLPTSGRIDAIRIVDPSGQEIMIFREGWTAP